MSYGDKNLAARSNIMNLVQGFRSGAQNRAARSAQSLGAAKSRMGAAGAQVLDMAKQFGMSELERKREEEDYSPGGLKYEYRKDEIGWQAGADERVAKYKDELRRVAMGPGGHDRLSEEWAENLEFKLDKKLEEIRNKHELALVEQGEQTANEIRDEAFNRAMGQYEADLAYYDNLKTRHPEIYNEMARLSGDGVEDPEPFAPFDQLVSWTAEIADRIGLLDSREEVISELGTYVQNKVAGNIWSKGEADLLKSMVPDFVDWAYGYGEGTGGGETTEDATTTQRTPLIAPKAGREDVVVFGRKIANFAKTLFYGLAAVGAEDPTLARRAIANLPDPTSIDTPVSSSGIGTSSLSPVLTDPLEKETLGDNDALAETQTTSGVGSVLDTLRRAGENPAIEGETTSLQGRDVYPDWADKEEEKDLFDYINTLKPKDLDEPAGADASGDPKTVQWQIDYVKRNNPSPSVVQKILNLIKSVTQ